MVDLRDVGILWWLLFWGESALCYTSGWYACAAVFLKHHIHRIKRSLLYRREGTIPGLWMLFLKPSPSIESWVEASHCGRGLFSISWPNITTALTLPIFHWPTYFRSGVTYAPKIRLRFHWCKSRSKSFFSCPSCFHVSHVCGMW